MKKIIFAITMLLVASTASAQLIKSTSVAVQKSAKKNYFAIEFGSGFFTGDIEKGGAVLDLSLRDTYMFHPNIGWDILKFTAQTGTGGFADCLDLQIKTGVRGMTPVLFGQSTIYVNAGAGYNYWVGDAGQAGGFTWEAGAGLNITPHFLVGINYSSVKVNVDTDEKYTVGAFTFRVGYSF